MPSRYVDPAGRAERGRDGAFVVEVDGERFAVDLVVDAATGSTDVAYSWSSGPNEGYGFGVTGPGEPSLEDHRQRIREFLAMVDPETGYIEDD